MYAYGNKPLESMTKKTSVGLSDKPLVESRQKLMQSHRSLTRASTQRTINLHRAATAREGGDVSSNFPMTISMKQIDQNFPAIVQNQQKQADVMKKLFGVNVR